MGLPEENRTSLSVWNYKTFKVYYHQDIDGGGRWLAKPTIEFLKRYYPHRAFGTIFEWGCGPGFIGFALLAEGMCKQLCLADINPEAIRCVEKTVTANNLHTEVRSYVSDNFKAIPENERFDLVVSNPPLYFAINPDHPLYPQFKDDIRPNDPGWKIHEEFYAQVRNYLHPNALLCISEVEPYQCEVYLPHFEAIPYDKRIEPPINTFKRMIKEAGLTYVNTQPYTSLENVQFFMVISSYTQNK